MEVLLFMATSKGTGLDIQKLLGVLPPSLAKEYLSSLGKNAQGKKREVEETVQTPTKKHESESHDHSAEDLKSSSGEENDDFRRDWVDVAKDFQHRKKKTERFVQEVLILQRIKAANKNK